MSLLICPSIVNIAINLTSEEAGVSYPECILWATTYHMSYCALNGMSYTLPPT